MQCVETSIEVSGSVSTVYEQWKRFENVPCFPENDGPRRVGCDADGVLGAVPESNAPIVEYQPPQRIVSCLAMGSFSRRTVAFHPASTGTTRVTLSIEYEADGNVEDIGRCLNASKRRIQADLRRFGRYMKARTPRRASVRYAEPAGAVVH